MEISEKRLLLRIIEFVIVFIIIITFFPAEKLNAALSASYTGLAKNIYLTLIIMLAILSMMLVANIIVRRLIPKHYKEAEILPPENKRAKEKAPTEKKPGKTRGSFWRRMLRSAGFLKTEKEKLAEKLEREQYRRKIELERKIRKSSRRESAGNKTKIGWMRMFRPKIATKEDRKKLESEVPIPQKRIEMLQKSAPVALKKGGGKKEGIFNKLFANINGLKNEVVLQKKQMPKKIEVPMPPKKHEMPKESIFNRISKNIEKLKHEMRQRALKRGRMKMRKEEHSLKKEGENRMLAAVSKEEKAKRDASIKRTESEKKLNAQEKEAKQKFGKVARELSDKIQQKDSRLQEGEPEPPEEKAKRRILENIRQLFHPGIMMRYGIRRANVKKLKMKRKEIEKERKDLERAKKEFEQKKAQEEKLKRMLEQSQMKKIEQQRKNEKMLAKKVPKPSHKHEGRPNMHEDAKRREEAHAKEEMRKKQEEEFKRKNDEDRKRIEELRQRQIEADKKKEDYRKKIGKEMREKLAKKQQVAMTKEAPKEKIIETLHKAGIIKSEEPNEIKLMDEMISKEIYKMLEEMAGYYIHKDYGNAKIVYSRINLKYGQLSEEGKAIIKPIINKVVTKISQ